MHLFKNKIIEKYKEVILKLENYNEIKVKKRCEYLCTDVLKYIEEDKIKKSDTINCFNWFEIYIKILENETIIQYGNKNSKDYIVTHGGKRIYKIVSRPTEYINQTTDCNFDEKYCIFDIIDKFIYDAENMDCFPYKENYTQLVMIFIDNNISQEILDELTKKSIIPITKDNIYELDCPKKTDTINIDINILVGLCSDINYLDYLDNNNKLNILNTIVTQKIYVGYDSKVINYNIDELYTYIQNEKTILIDKINSYKKIIICKNAYNDSLRIINMYGSDTEKNRLNNIMKKFNIQIIEDDHLKCDIIETNFCNNSKKYNNVEINVAKIGYLYDAITITSNHKYIHYLQSKNIFIEYDIITTPNLIQKIYV